MINFFPEIRPSSFFSPPCFLLAKPSYGAFLFGLGGHSFMNFHAPFPPGLACFPRPYDLVDVFKYNLPFLAACVKNILFNQLFFPSFGRWDQSLLDVVVSTSDFAQNCPFSPAVAKFQTLFSSLSKRALRFFSEIGKSCARPLPGKRGPAPPIGVVAFRSTFCPPKLPIPFFPFKAATNTEVIRKFPLFLPFFLMDNLFFPPSLFFISIAEH